jgi:hypothetical protein
MDAGCWMQPNFLTQGGSIFTSMLLRCAFDIIYSSVFCSCNHAHTLYTGVAMQQIPEIQVLFTQTAYCLYFIVSELCMYADRNRRTVGVGS